MFRRLIKAGVHDELPDYLKDKVLISNQVALLMTLVAFCYTVFSMMFYPPLTVYPFLAIIICFIAIILNLFSLYTISRFIISTVIILLATLYHGFFVQENKPVLTSMILIQLALSVIPWVVIDFRE